MRVPYGEGVASHTGPESCGGVRKAAVEALTGVRAGQPLSPEIFIVPGADAVPTGGRQHPACRPGETRPDPAGSETLSTHVSTSRGGKRLLLRKPGDPAADRAACRRPRPAP